MEILLVEDNEGYIDLTLDAFADSNLSSSIHVARDGEEALDFLFRRQAFIEAVRPDIILLDLNLPKVDGIEILKIVKSDSELKTIPIIVLTSSQSHKDISNVYNFHANSYVVKPMEFGQFSYVIQQIESFWNDIVCLPKG